MTIDATMEIATMEVAALAKHRERTVSQVCARSPRKLRSGTS